MYLGLDLGTSAVKAHAHRRRAGRRRLGLRAARGGAAAARLVRAETRATGSRPPSARSAPCARRTRGALAAVRGIGLSGQMHGATLLDERDEPLRPCILWNDTRAHARSAPSSTRDARFRAITGNIVFPGFTAPKVAWVAAARARRHSSASRWVLLPKDYLRLWLTGEHVSEMSDASGTSWLDTGARALVRRAARGDGLSARQMPALVEGTAAERHAARASSPRAGACAATSSSPAAPATTRPRPAGSARCATARRSSRSAPRACCSRPTARTRRTPRAPCTPSVTRCRPRGIRWA